MALEGVPDTRPATVFKGRSFNLVGRSGRAKPKTRGTWVHGTIILVTVEICRGSSRFSDREPGRMTWHAFSFGPHYDPDRLGYGPIVCHDEHLLGDAHGFDTHRHSGIEIVTWVVSGAVRHTDSTGSVTDLTPGSVGVLAAGSGVEHSEIAVAPATRFIQVWLTSDAPDRDPAYTATPVDLEDGRFVEAARPRPDAVFSIARLAAGETISIPPSERRHLFVSRGALLRSSLAEPLQAGDAFMIGSDDAVEVTAGVPTELLLWSLT